MPRRTLLLTDVVDSTKLSEELGDAAMAALWARHDRVARDLLTVHGGREIDKTDGFLMLFDRPSIPASCRSTSWAGCLTGAPASPCARYAAARWVR